MKYMYPTYKLDKEYQVIMPQLMKIINYIRGPRSKPLMASTQLNYTYEMFRTVKEVEKIDLGATRQGKSLLKNLRIQAFLDTNRAPAYKFADLTEMFNVICASPKQTQLMLLAFMTAARIGHLHHLSLRGREEKGWRFTWLYHKMFYTRGPVDVLVPDICVPKELTNVLTYLPPGPVCSAEEKDDLYALLEQVYHGRTYSIRRSSIQHMKYTLGMTHNAMMEITLHESEASLKSYLASPKDFD